MKYLRIAVVIIFCISVAAYGAARYYDYKNHDSVPPVITIEGEQIDYNVLEPDTTPLMQGVTASDNRDGDITSQVVVENMGPLLSDLTRDVTYVVCDSYNNIARASRKIRLRKYSSPRWQISEPLRFPNNKIINLASYITATDCLDDAISNRIRCTSGYFFDSSEPGGGEMSFQVTNSASDTSFLDVYVEIYDAEESNYLPVIQLKKNIVNVKVNGNLDPYYMLEYVTCAGRTYEINRESKKVNASSAEKRVKGLFGNRENIGEDDELIEELRYRDFYIDSNLDLSTPGNYLIKYTINTDDGYSTTVGLPVIVH
ncbi:MAG: hypothetical protein II627_06790 [Lachnospiraceae bacterium]|nr:hypothetical protein [Lachnospiraceae bacterium]